MNIQNLRFLTLGLILLAVPLSARADARYEGSARVAGCGWAGEISVGVTAAIVANDQIHIKFEFVGNGSGNLGSGFVGAVSPLLSETMGSGLIDYSFFSGSNRDSERDVSTVEFAGAMSSDRTSLSNLSIVLRSSSDCAIKVNASQLNWVSEEN